MPRLLRPDVPTRIIGGSCGVRPHEEEDRTVAVDQLGLIVGVVLIVISVVMIAAIVRTVGADSRR